MIRRNEPMMSLGRRFLHQTAGRPWWPWRGALVVAAAVALVVALSIGLGGCQSQPKATPSRGPAGTATMPTPPALPSATLAGQPLLRVRIASGLREVQITGSGGLIVGPTPEQAHLAAPRAVGSRVQIFRWQGSFALRTPDGQGVQWALSELMLRDAGGGVLHVNGIAYPAQVAIVPAVGADNLLDAVNHVAMEDYLPGVLAKELYAAWQPAAFEAQAIAARSYAVVQWHQNQRRHYDLESTTASQAYGGSAAHDKARRAVAVTRGIILAYQGQVLPAYYSSCCGGTGQDASAAFPRGMDIAPLMGRARAAWCQASPQFRWGPIVRDRRVLVQRMAAWGRSAQHAVASLRTIGWIGVVRTNAAGRPALFRITDPAGLSFLLGPEEFRFACNSSAPGQPDVPAAQQLRSSHVQVNVIGDQVQFLDGRGFGHGVGLCQWGAQGMAMAGMNAQSILAQYYPGADLRQAY